MSNQVRNFAKTTTIHGLGELLLARNKITKVVWTTLMLASIGVCIWQLWDSIDDFRQGPTVTKLGEIPLTEFPKTRFHLYNSIDERKMRKFGLNWTHLLVLWDHFPGTPLLTFQSGALPSQYIENNGLSKKDALGLQNDLRKLQIAQNLTTMADLIKQLAYSPEDLFSFDWFKGEASKGQISVDVDVTGISYVVEKTNLSIPFDVRSYHFNTNTVRGRGIGLTIKSLALSWPYQRETMSVVAPGLYMLKSNMHGWWYRALLTMGDERFESWKWERLDGIVYGNIIVDVRKVRSINSKKRPCAEDYHSQLQCETDCWARNQVCGQDCKWFTEGNLTGTERACLGGVDGDNGNADCMNCTEICIPSCERWEYTRNIAITEGYGSLWDGRDITIAVIMSAMQATFIEEQYSYPMSQLFSNVGGILSLYIGASVLSFAHLVYFWTVKWAWEEEEKGEGSK